MGFLRHLEVLPKARKAACNGSPCFGIKPRRLFLEELLPSRAPLRFVDGAKIRLVFVPTKFRLKKQPTFCPLGLFVSKTAYFLSIKPKKQITNAQGQKKRQMQCILSFFVPHTRVELVIYCVRGSCPGPLDECGFSGDFPFEIGCKITTFFRYGKLFKAFFFIVSHYTLSDNQLPVVFFSCHPPLAGNKRGIYIRFFTNIAPLRPARMSTKQRFSS